MRPPQRPQRRCHEGPAERAGGSYAVPLRLVPQLSGDDLRYLEGVLAPRHGAEVGAVADDPGDGRGVPAGEDGARLKPTILVHVLLFSGGPAGWDVVLVERVGDGVEALAVRGQGEQAQEVRLLFGVRQSYPPGRDETIQADAARELPGFGHSDAGCHRFAPDAGVLEMSEEALERKLDDVRVLRHVDQAEVRSVDLEAQLEQLVKKPVGGRHVARESVHPADEYSLDTQVFRLALEPLEVTPGDCFAGDHVLVAGNQLDVI